MQYGINNLSHMASKAEQFIIEWIHNIYNHFNWCVLSCDHFIFMILHIWGKLEIETGLKPKTTLLLVFLHQFSWCFYSNFFILNYSFFIH